MSNISILKELNLYEECGGKIWVDESKIVDVSSKSAVSYIAICYILKHISHQERIILI